jgi:calcineurin-like phosphoesterase
MKILFIGDIVGKPGRRAIRELLPQIVSADEIDCVIANCENAAAGFGVTRDIVDELFQSHIDVLTSGNHIWDKKEAIGFINCSVPPITLKVRRVAEVLFSRPAPATKLVL